MFGDDVRVLATVGAFRVVPAGDLREPKCGGARPSRSGPRAPSRRRPRAHHAVHRRADADNPGPCSPAIDGSVLEQGRRPGFAGAGQAYYIITKPASWPTTPGSTARP